MKKDYILGLDLGTNSVGWAILAQDKDGFATRIIDAGSRIFTEAVERKTGNTKNKKRRECRGTRRIKNRRKERKHVLTTVLQDHGLLPEDNEQLLEILSLNPYALRKRGLDEELTLEEFARVLYHLNQRRGFKSNRKEGNDKKESKIVKVAITALEKEMEDAGSRTVGEHFAAIEERGERVRGQYTSRAMYEHEFNILWDIQAAYHPVLDDAILRAQAYHAVFFQNPLRGCKHLVGKCEFEPSKKRAPKGSWYFQQARLLQTLNGMQATNMRTGEVITIDENQRQTLLTALTKTQKRTFDQIRKLLDLNSDWRFSLESEKRKHLNGNETEWNLRVALKDKYDALTTKVRDEIIHDLLFLEENEPIRKHAKERWGFDDETADALVARDLASSYGSVSEKALKLIIPHLTRGLDYYDSLRAAGYCLKVQSAAGIYTLLPKPKQLTNTYVNRALNQTRKVVNAIIKKYGTPTTIRLEMARELKKSPTVIGLIEKEQATNQRTNEYARAALKKDFNISKPSRDDLLKYKLWKECEKVCPYTGRIIPQHELFSAEWEIEHILPYSRSLDDGYMNKTLCARGENRTKANRTPYECYGHNETHWTSVTARAADLPWPKQRRFLQLHLSLDSCIERQLKDTQYIAREAREYLEHIVGRNKVQVTQGRTTAILRRFWDLNSILSHDANIKSRDDHRHHAVDAIVIALTCPTTVRLISKLSKYRWKRKDQKLPTPWPSLAEDTRRAVDKIIVSHEPLRKIRGALHEETNYGILDLTNEKGQALFAVRKEVTRLTLNEVSKIADPVIQRIICDKLEAAGIDLQKKSITFADKKAIMLALEDVFIPRKDGTKTPVKRVRLHMYKSNMLQLTRKGDNKPYRAVAYGSNHNAAIYIDDNNVWQVKVTSMLDAAQRVRAGKPAVDHDSNLGTFHMALHPNETVKIDNNYYRVQKFDATGGIVFRAIEAARLTDRATMVTGRAKGLQQKGVEKVEVTVLGEVHTRSTATSISIFTPTSYGAATEPLAVACSGRG